jgi:hypothetical protein
VIGHCECLSGLVRSYASQLDVAATLRMNDETESDEDGDDLRA